MLTHITCFLSTTDSPADFCVCAPICLSHLNCNHASIAIVPNGFYCAVIAEYINSYRVNENVFSPCTAKRLSSVLQVPAEWFEFIFTDKWFLRRLIAALSDWK